MNDINIIPIIIILSIIILIYVIYYNSFQLLLMKINDVESKIDNILRERFDLLIKISLFIKEHLKEDIMIDLDKIKDEELSSFELDRRLDAYSIELYELKISNKNILKLDNYIDLEFELKENEAKLHGYTLYYNDNISKYNRLIRMFPSNVIAKISRFRERTFFDGKNLNDKKINDFKL